MIEETGSPIIVFGAGRSGTKLLRGILAASPECRAFPKEINYIWRYGNSRNPTDELTSADARPEVRRYIRKRFRRFVAPSAQLRIVEKTCANSLRVPFVREVFPEAHLLHIVRDGRSVVESARRMWMTPHRGGYLLAKARWLPARDALHYALRYLRFQAGRFSSDERRPGSWGPRYAGIDEDIVKHSLVEVCALQWRACVRAAQNGLKGLEETVGTTVRYEDLVANPHDTLKGVFEKLNLPYEDPVKSHVEETVHDGKLEGWKSGLTAEELEKVNPIINSDLKAFGYVA